MLTGLEVGRRVELDGLELHPPQERTPDLRTTRVVADWPDPAELWRGVVDLGDVVVDGLRIDARTQQPPDHPPIEGGIELRADRLVATEAMYDAPAEPPLPEVVIEGIDASFRDVHWWPRARRIEGVGEAAIRHMALGAIVLDGIDAPSVQLDGDALELAPTTFHYGPTEALAQGTIRSIDTRPAVDLQVRLAGARVENAIAEATGRAAPVMGWLTSQVRVEAGGDRPVGGSRISGWVQLTDAHVFVGDDLKFIPKILLDLAPWFRREDGGWLSVGNLRGEAAFGRGWVDLTRLERPSDKNRVLQAWGHLRDGHVDVTVRAVPKRDEDKAGVGVHLEGPVGKAKLSLATKEQLLAAPDSIASAR